jgi:hypothetical protein
MRTRLFTVVGVAVVVTAVAVTVNLRSAETGGAPRTAWGEPDLQGIWTNEFDTPLQRAARYGTREFFTEEERAELDKERIALLGRDRRVERGTELDVAGAYNSVFMSMKRTGRRTSLIVNPSDGRVPSLTPEATQRAAADRAFRVALLQAIETCKNKSTACAGGKYDPTPSVRRAEALDRYNTGRMNRHNGPEDGSLADRCLSGNIPEFGTAYGGSFRRIVQTPNGVSIFYDVGQGQGFQRNIVMNGSPHLTGRVRQWHDQDQGHRAWPGRLARGCHQGRQQLQEPVRDAGAVLRRVCIRADDQVGRLRDGRARMGVRCKSRRPRGHSTRRQSRDAAVQCLSGRAGGAAGNVDFAVRSGNGGSVTIVCDDIGRRLAARPLCLSAGGSHLARCGVAAGDVSR